MASTHHAYLDESGQREYGPATDRYYVVAGVIAKSQYVDRYGDELSGIKRAFFGHRDVEVKSNWLRIPEERKEHYLQPYGITNAKLDGFVEAMYDWLVATRLTLIAGVVDKVQMEEDYSDPHHPSAVGYQVFLQRYQKFLASRRGVGAVTADEPSGKSEAGNEWKLLLRRQHKKLKKHGCNYTGATFDNIEDALDFGDSAELSLIQMADVVAYNTFRQFRDHGKHWDDPGAKRLPVYEHFDRLMPRFHRGRDNVFAGFGVAKMPTRAKHSWVA